MSFATSRGPDFHDCSGSLPDTLNLLINCLNVFSRRLPRGKGLSCTAGKMWKCRSSDMESAQSSHLSSRNAGENFAGNQGILRASANMAPCIASETTNLQEVNCWMKGSTPWRAEISWTPAARQIGSQLI